MSVFTFILISDVMSPISQRQKYERIIGPYVNMERAESSKLVVQCMQFLIHIGYYSEYKNKMIANLTFKKSFL